MVDPAGAGFGDVGYTDQESIWVTYAPVGGAAEIGKLVNGGLVDTGLVGGRLT